MYDEYDEYDEYKEYDKQLEITERMEWILSLSEEERERLEKYWEEQENE